MEARIDIERVLLDERLVSQVDPGLIRQTRAALHWRYQFIHTMRQARPDAWTGYDEREFMDQLLAFYNFAGALTEAAGTVAEREHSRP